MCATMQTLNQKNVASILFLSMATLATCAFADEKTYIVQLDPPETAFVTLDERKTWYSSFLGEERSIIYAYENVLNGFAARLTEAEVEEMREKPGFVAAYPDTILPLETSYSAEFLGLNPTEGLWTETNFGTGVIIGVLDTGIWPESPSFDDSGMLSPPAKWKGVCESARDFNASICNNKLIGARFFHRGAGINETNSGPRDTNGHGTHTASIAAGSPNPNANFSGYAPGTAWGMALGAHIAVYKACWENGCANSDMLAGMDQAVTDGVDVISISIRGLSTPFNQNSIAIGAFTAVQKGIFVSCSAGNSGPDQSTVKHEAPWIMTVGASTMDRRFIANVHLGDGRVFDGESLYPGKGLSDFVPLVHVNTETGSLCLPGSLTSSDVAGKIVVCQRDENNRMLNENVAQAAGAVGMILVANEKYGEATVAEPHVYAVTDVSYSAGVAIKAYLDSTNSPTAAINFQGTGFGNKKAPAVAYFSSRGPGSVSREILKPDVISPGVSVLGAWPSNVIGLTDLFEKRKMMRFRIVSGTSMACPHVSGIAALLKAAHPDWSPAAIKSALMTTADVSDKQGLPIIDSITNTTADVFAIGAGHINPENAANPGLVYDLTPDDYIPYLCGLNYTARQVRAIVGKIVACPNDPETTRPGNLNYPSFTAVFDTTATPVSTTFKRTVTNVGEASSTYVASIEAPSGVEVTVSPSDLSFTEVMEKQNFNITFTVQTSVSQSFAQGSLTWISNSTSTVYKVRSPIAIIWPQST